MFPPSVISCFKSRAAVPLICPSSLSARRRRPVTAARRVAFLIDVTSPFLRNLQKCHRGDTKQPHGAVTHPVNTHPLPAVAGCTEPRAYRPSSDALPQPSSSASCSTTFPTMHFSLCRDHKHIPVSVELFYLAVCLFLFFLFDTVN